MPEMLRLVCALAVRDDTNRQELEILSAKN